MSGALNRIIGQPRAVRFLRAALAQPSHAYLFVGAPHVGKTATALAFAQALNCEHRSAPGGLMLLDVAPSEPDACGECLECRSIEHANHPDVRFVEPSEGKKVFSVEDVRKLVEEVGWKAYRARHKVYVIPNELLNLQGANTLLKTIEEPQPGTTLILTANSLDHVLPTLVSRCQPVPFGPVPSDQIADWLAAEKGVDPDRARVLARISDGRIGWAAQLAESGEVPEPVLLVAGDYAATLKEAERLAAEDGETQQVALEALIAQVRDIMVWLQTGRADWVARPEQVERAARRSVSLGYWLRVMRHLEQARKQLLGHANAKLLWTVLAGDVQPTAREVAQA
ncbi:MAG TPA: hypothetical protein V6D05_18285 [Stenomitos sp.]